jgi:uncharacterized protein (TIGR04551 family)
MSYSTRIALVLVLIGTAPAQAQISPGGGMPGGAGQQQEEQKKEGVAEAAPKAPGLLPTTPALPPPKGRRKRWKLLEIDGYFRLRTDWFKNFNLGHLDTPGLGGAPFPRALSCGAPAIVGAGCDDALSSANMRLRLEPTINLDERTSIHFQADIFDNLVLGSTPIDQHLSYAGDDLPPIGAFSGTQGYPQAGVNSDRDSIAVKRAWAEVAVPLGILKFGRQPNHWGMGIWHNAGGLDPISGTYDADADYGDSVDRVSFSALIPGTNLRAMVASDWNITRLVSNQTSANQGREGHPWDLDDKDDSNGWVGVISRMDSPQEFRDRVDRGELAFNYGVYFEYKTQEYDNDLRGFTPGGTLDTAGGGTEETPARYVPRGLKTYSPDAWVKLGYRQFTFEAEAVAQLGRVSRLDEAGVSAADIRKYGGTGRLTFRGLEGKLRLGVEGGAASGDQWDNSPPGNTHIAYAQLLGGAGDGKLTQFLFNRDYRVDMILFRHLIGAVTNAGYVKPFLAYDLTKSIGIKPVATPGNDRMYGTEFNADVGYTAGGFYGGASYGVLFPFGALSHPDGLGYQIDPVTLASNIGDASTAHTIQFRLVLSF